MTHHTISLEENAEEIYKKRFGKNSISYGKFSEWVCNQLIYLEEMKYDLATLIIKKEKLKLDSEKIKKEIEQMAGKIKTSKEIEKAKFTLSNREVSYLNDSKQLMESDGSKLYPRIRGYCNLFSKEVNEEEFFKLIDLAGDDYPFTGSYIDSPLVVEEKK